jgi:AraC-like DNA-binding protein
VTVPGAASSRRDAICGTPGSPGARLAGRPISAIAHARGFGDLSGFNRAFRQAYAVSPENYANDDKG